MHNRGFWSYDSTSRENSRKYHNACQDLLKGRFSNHGDFSIFFDHHPRTGITPGREWGRALVESLSQTMVFFWWQSERWFTRAACRFEYDVFEAQVDAIADHFSVDRARLRETLMVPIRWDNLDENEWAEMPSDVRSRFEMPFKTRQVEQTLNLHDAYRRGAGSIEDPWSACKGPCDRTVENMRTFFPSLEPLFAFVATPRKDFINRWLSEFRARKIDEVELRPDAKVTSGDPGHLRLETLPALRLDLISLPNSDGPPIAAATRPLDPAQVARLGLELMARRDAAGNYLWSDSDARAIAAHLPYYSLALPSAREAEVMRDCARDYGAQRPGSFKLPARFWTGEQLEEGIEGRYPLVVLKPHGSHHGRT